MQHLSEKNYTISGFYHAMLCYAMPLSCVCLYVSLSHSSIVSKQLNVGSRK